MGIHVTQSLESKIESFPAFPVASEGSFSAAQQEEGQVSETRGVGHEALGLRQRQLSVFIITLRHLE